MHAKTPLHLNLHHAIEHQLLIRFRYNAQDTWRVVEPFCLGQTSAGNLGLRAYQVDGPNESELGWKMFDLNKASDLLVLSKEFSSEERGDYHIGDKHMKTIYRQVY